MLRDISALWHDVIQFGDGVILNFNMLEIIY
jgi:hypothetical protein